MNRLKYLYLALCLAVPLSATTIDYRFVSGVDVDTASFDSTGVTVTGGPGLVFVNVSNGLSVFGGGNDSAVNVGEFLSFSFDAGPATGISFEVNNAITATATLQAFGPGGSLGSQSVSVSFAGPPIDVSGLFGNQPISNFTLTTTAGAYRLDILTFAPEPSSFVLLFSGFVAIGALRIRRSISKTKSAT
jgi:hypothetical protein